VRTSEAVGVSVLAVEGEARGAWFVCLTDGQQDVEIDVQRDCRRECVQVEEVHAVCQAPGCSGQSRGACRAESDTFTTIDFPRPANRTLIFGINPRGDIVGTYRIGRVFHVFLLSGGEFTSIDFPGARFDTEAIGINPGGDIVGEYASADVTHGFLLSGGEFTSIDFPGASGTVASGINPRGGIVGFYVSAGVGHGFLLSR
jgi:hypothetical protein